MLANNTGAHRLPSACRAARRHSASQQRPLAAPCRAATHTVSLTHEGVTHTLSVGEDQSILDVALEQGVSVPHDCRMGVCMTCPGRLESGAVDSELSMLSDDVQAQGYVLLCAARPTRDCAVRTVDEGELLDIQLRSGA